MSVPITSINPLAGGLLISWIAPYDDSQAITSYFIEVSNFDSSAWIQDLVNCPGTNPALLLCTIPMSVLAAAPYNYAYDSLVKVRISAINFFGTSPVSVVNSTGANTRRVPDKMAEITVTGKTENEIKISWTALTGTQTGNSVILGYTLYFDNASGTSNIELVDTLLTSFNI